MCGESPLSGILPQWKTPEELPIRFLYGEKPVRGIPAQWKPQTTVHTTAKSIKPDVWWVDAGWYPYADSRDKGLGQIDTKLPDNIRPNFLFLRRNKP